MLGPQTGTPSKNHRVPGRAPKRERPSQFVPPGHEPQLRGTLEHLQIRLGQQETLDFGDPAGGIRLYQSAFAAHFPQLLDRVG